MESKKESIIKENKSTMEIIKENGLKLIDGQILDKNGNKYEGKKFVNTFLGLQELQDGILFGEIPILLKYIEEEQNTKL